MKKGAEEGGTEGEGTLWHGLAPALVGLAAGVAGALALGRLLALITL